MKIGVYGGAFNPVHYGHLRTAEEVREILSLEKIIFIPSGRTPFDKPDMAKASHRYEMVRRAVRGNRCFTVSDIEIKSRSRSYTIDTVRKLKSKFPRGRIFFILGIDAFLDLPHWKEPDLLMELVNFTVISRPGFLFAGLSSSPYLKGIAESTLKELDRGVMTEAEHEVPGRQKVFLCSVTGLDISASHIRAIIRAGKNLNYLLPDSVKSYIISHKLYKNKR